MNRRNFIIKSAIVGSAESIASSCAGDVYPEKKSNDKKQMHPLEKVIQAMLSMQKASWEYGVAAQAMFELGNAEMLYLMAKEAVLRQQNDGRLSVVYSDNGVTDSAASGEVVFRAYQMFGDNEFKTACDKMLEWLLVKAPKSKKGILYHTLNSPEIWSDSLYMAPPFISVTGNHKKAIYQIEGMMDILWDKKNKLFFHRWHDEKQDFIVQRHWGSGNGWAAACFSRVILSLPEIIKEEKEKLAQYHIELLDGYFAHMTKDAMFYDFVDEPNTFKEFNLGQMLAYSVFRVKVNG